MKTSTYLEELAKKAEVQTPELLAKINQLQGDVPDELQAVLDNLISMNAAKSKADIAAFHVSKHNHNVDQAHTSKLQAAGFTDTEIAEILATPISERINMPAVINEKKINLRNAGTKDQQVLILEKQLEEAKIRADSYQKASLNKDTEYSRKLDLQRGDVLLERIIEGLPLRKDTIPLESAVPLVMATVKNSLASKGAKMVFLQDGRAKIVKMEDETVDFYDEKSNTIDPKQFVQNVVQGLNLLNKTNQPTTPSTAQKQTFISSSSNQNMNSAQQKYMQTALAQYQR